MSAHTAPATTFSVLVDMGPVSGLVTLDVVATSYAEAYRGAVEALLLDPTGTLAAEATARLEETYA